MDDRIDTPEIEQDVEATPEVDQVRSERTLDENLREMLSPSSALISSYTNDEDEDESLRSLED